ncbi:MAG TPA: ThuA domain-containing protein [bacterium]|nr:ThuA domain-containing protein [bacterium]HPN42853.1 ThuA domain-containing protein [bacterium]
MKIKSVISLLLIILLVAAFSCQSGKKRALVYSKNGEGYVHDNIAASVQAVSELCMEMGVAVEATDDPSVFNDAKLQTFSVIIFCNTNNDAFANDEQREAFKKYIQSGGGFVGIHSACGSERNWPWFWAMLGGKFLRHPSLQPFAIKPVDKQDPASCFLPDPWQWEDECYYIDHLNPDIHVLLAVDLTTIDDPDRATYPGVTFGDLFPLAWRHEYDGGRQFYTALGHKIEHYADANFLKHLQAGINWAISKN